MYCTNNNIAQLCIVKSVLLSMQDSSWTDIRCPFEKRRDATAVFWDNVVYILGGSQLFPIKRMDCYNVLKDSWYSKLGPPTPRDSLAACAAQGKIYTSGGSEVGENMDVGEDVGPRRLGCSVTTEWVKGYLNVIMVCIN